MDIENAASESLHNSAAVKGGVVCGCYFCLSLFNGAAVTDFVDEGETALCPRCGIDAVLPGVNDTDILAKAHERWFTGSERTDQ